MQFSCESCKTQLQIADEKVRGKRLIVRCKRCGAKIAISDPALGPARPRLVSVPPAAGAVLPAAARPAVAPSPIAPPSAAAAPTAAAASRDALPRDGDSDTDSTRAMDSDLLEQALQASKVEEPPERAAAPSASARPAPAAKPQTPPPAVEPADVPLWFAMLHGKQQGPLTRAELRARTDEGEVGPRTYLWKDGMDAWQRAKDLPDLQELFPQLPDAPSLPPPTAPPKAAPLREFSPDFGAKAPPAAAAAAAKPLPAKPASVQAASLQAASLQSAPAQSAPAQSQDEPTAVDPLPLGERVHQEGVGRELFTPEPGDVQKQPADLASWAASELQKKPAPRPSATPEPRPSVTPEPRMFEGAAEPRSRGPFVLVVLGVVAIAAVSLWLIYERESRAAAQPPKADEARAATPGAPAPPAPVPAAAPRGEKPPARPEPKPAASTGLTADQVRRKLDENKSALQGCIDEALRRDPNLRVGKIHIATTIAPTGAVTQTKIDKNTVDQSPLGACLRRATRKIAFPPFSGEAFNVDIPIVVTAGE